MEDDLTGQRLFLDYLPLMPHRMFVPSDLSFLNIPVYEGFGRHRCESVPLVRVWGALPDGRRYRQAFAVYGDCLYMTKPEEI